METATGIQPPATGSSQPSSLCSQPSAHPHASGHYHTTVSVYHFVNYVNVSHSKEPLGLAFVQASALWVHLLVFRAYSFLLLSSVPCNGYILGSPLNGSWADSSFCLWMRVLQTSLSVGHCHVTTTTRFSETNMHMATVGPQHNWILDCRTNLHTASKSSSSIFPWLVVNPSPFNPCPAVSCAFTVCWIPSSEVLHHNISLYFNVHSSISSHLDYFLIQSSHTFFHVSGMHRPNENIYSQTKKPFKTIIKLWMLRESRKSVSH